MIQNSCVLYVHVDLVYMTGILPIKRYNGQSTLNVFKEYTILNPEPLETFFGFTEVEVKELSKNSKVPFKELKEWYDGYKINGIDIYNPQSVVEAVSRGKCNDYWAQTSAMDSVMNYMNSDNGELRSKILGMLAGEEIEVETYEFNTDLTKINNFSVALTVLIHLGYLAYTDGKCYIPNYEIAQKLTKAIKKLDWTEISNPINESMKLYEETLKGNTLFINQQFDKYHKELSSRTGKRNEEVFHTITDILYYNLRRYYSLKKKENIFDGRLDLAYHPVKDGYPPILIELKINSSASDALKQIKEKNYIDVFREDNYHGKVYLIGINANMNKDGKYYHESIIEVVEI